MHEIVTIQCGSQSNFVGTHFWNAQESYFTYSDDAESPIDHDVHFRQGIAPDGSDTYTPRALIYDHRSNFGTLRQTNALYEVTEEQNQQLPPSLWPRGATVQRQPPIEPHPYQRSLDAGVEPVPPSTDSVRYWSDFNRVYYHPRSLVPLEGDSDFTYGAQLSAWAGHDFGHQTFDSLNGEHDLLDHNLRPFVEEADNLQGFSILADVDNAWGGFASEFVEKVEDEYPRIPRWIWGCHQHVRPPVSAQRRTQLQLNLIRSLCWLTRSGTLYLPLSSVPLGDCPSYLSLERDNRWQTSALQMAPLESITLQSRLRANNAGWRRLADLEETATGGNDNRKVLNIEYSVQSSVPTRAINGLTNGHTVFRPGAALGWAETEEPERLDIALAPPSPFGTADIQHRSSRDHTFSHIDVYRGPGGIQDDRDPFSPPGPHSSIYSTPQLFPVLSSYPPIFHTSPVAQEDGLAIHARMSATSNVAKRLLDYARYIREFDGSLHTGWHYDELRDLADEYVDGWSPDSDEGDDE